MAASDKAMPLPVNAALLDDVRQSYRRGDTETVKRVDVMKAYAEKLIKAKPVVVTDKKRIAPSNDPRDYITLSPYWWRDTTKTDGLPYVRRDGKRNPEVYEYANREQGNDIGERVEITSVLYYITGDRRYAKACAVQLRAWFTDANTHVAAYRGLGRMDGCRPQATQGMGRSLLLLVGTQHSGTQGIESRQQSRHLV